MELETALDGLKPLMTPSGQRVRDAALRLFARKGYQATGIREIAAEAGISVATLYNYMNSKEDLLIRIMEHGIRRLDAAARMAIEDVDDPVEQLARIIRVHVWSHGTRQLAAQVADAEVRSLTGDYLALIQRLRDRYERLWRDVLEAGIAAGSMTLQSSKLGAFALLEMCTGVSHWYRSDGSMSLGEVCDDFVVMGVALTGARRSGVVGELGGVATLDLKRLFADVDSRLAEERVLL